MKSSQKISAQRELLKQEITELTENTFSARILRVLGSWLQRLTRQSAPPPWYVSTVLLAIIVVLPQALLAFILKEPDQFIGSGLIWSISVWIIVPVIPTFYLSAKYILTIIRDHIVDSMEEPTDLDDLRSFLMQLKNHRKAFLHALTASFIWSLLAISIFSFLSRNFIGPSLALDVWVWGFCGPGIGFYFVLWYMQFPNRLKNYRYNLYELNPASSEVLIHISTIFARPFLVFALYIAIGTVVCGVFDIFFWVIFVVVILFWIPLIIQFVNSQTAIRKIVSTKKWQTLNDLQKQIHEYRNHPNQNSSENIEVVSKLMDLHEKVYTSSNIKLTLGGIFDLFGQLVLPILTLVVSNIDNIKNLFK